MFRIACIAIVGLAQALDLNSSYVDKAEQKNVVYDYVDH